MIRGRPGEKQGLVRSLPNPPASRSATLASAMAWYSGMSGAFWPRPTVLVGSNEAGPGAMLIRVHCPRQSGYLESSKAEAAVVVTRSAARKVAPIRLRLCMTVLLSPNGPIFLQPALSAFTRVFDALWSAAQCGAGRF